MFKFFVTALVLSLALVAVEAQEGGFMSFFYSPYETITDYFTGNDLEEAQAAQAEADTSNIIAAAKTREAAIKAQLSDPSAAEESLEAAEEAISEAEYANEVAAEESMEVMAQ